jgi:glycosyltransferase involved in cell wall biosynthesis/MoaA/NifB/PqqE/SkfB family radical SAM enzyme
MTRADLAGPMNEKKLKISVVVPAFNAAKSIEACVQSLKGQTYSLCEIIVVNDASTDNTAQLVRQLGVTLVDRKRNGGAGSARNTGVEAASGDIVAFTDADCTAPSTWIEKIAEEFLADPELGVVGGIYHPNHQVSSSVDLLCYFEEEFFWHISSKHPTEAFPPGGNLAVSRKIWKEGRSGLEVKLLKGFASGEDTLVCSELKKISKLKFIDSLFVHHRSPNHWKSYFLRHINRGLSRATLMANQLTVRSDVTVKAYGGASLMISNLFMGLFLLSFSFVPLFPIEAMTVGVASLFLQHWFSKPFFDLAKSKLLETSSQQTITLSYSIKIRLLLIVRLFCWVYGFVKGYLRHWLFKLKLLWNVTCSIIHFWIPGRISRLFYFVTSKCNARCEFCFNLDNVINWESRSSNELEIEEIIKIADKFGRLPYITLSGGEPFMRKDLAEVIRVFHERAKTQWVTIPTNAAITDNTITRVREILQECPGLFLTIQVSIDALFKDHDDSRKMPGGFEAMSETLKGLAKIRGHFKNLRIQINTCFDDFNVEQIQEIINHCKSHFNFDQQLFYLIRESEELITQKNNHLVPSFFEVLHTNEEREWKENKKNLWNRAVRVLQGLTYQDLADIKLKKKFIRPCYATEKFATLYDDGEISPCEVLAETVAYGNIKNFDYDYYKLREQPKVQQFYETDIKEKKCNCEWMCALPINMLYDPSAYIKVFKGLISPGKIVKSFPSENAKTS